MDIVRDSRCNLFQDSLDSQMKCLTSLGLGKERMQAKPTTEEADKILWSKGSLRNKEPKTLGNTLEYLFGKLLALRSAEEARSLTFAQLEVIEGDEGGGAYSTEVHMVWSRINGKMLTGRKHCKSRKVCSSLV